MEHSLDPAVVEALAGLTTPQQLEVVALAKQRKQQLSLEERAQKLRQLAGTLRPEDAQQMMEAIDEGCGRVNHAAW